MKTASEEPPKLSCNIDSNDELNVESRKLYKNSPHPEHQRLYELDKAFANEWRETFRRNLWLSGVNIECSAHEKLVWKRSSGETLKALWTRIWQPQQINVWQQAGQEYDFYYHALLSDDTHVMLSLEKNGKTRCTLTGASSHSYIHLTEENRIHEPSYTHAPSKANAQKEFAVKWLATFRRNAWLSGVTIDHNRHEE
ncbi:hypothetical protein EON83_30675, partial [bacterium]